MNKNGPIIVIEDDPDEVEIVKYVFERLGFNKEIVFFVAGEKALEYSNQEEVLPFLILSDINMPRLNGFFIKDTSEQQLQEPST